MRTHFDIDIVDPQFAGVSLADRKKVWRACLIKAFRHWQTWLGLLNWLVCVAIADRLTRWFIGPDELSWFSEFPYLGWRFAEYMVVPRVIAFVFVVGGFTLFSQAYDAQTRPYWRAYIQEHGLAKEQAARTTVLRVTGWHVLIVLLVITNLATALILGVVSWNANQERDNWRRELEFRAGQVGRLQASRDFRLGKKRLYELEKVKDYETGKAKFTGRKQGGFEIWTHPLYPRLGEPEAVSAQAFVKNYNDSMRRRKGKVNK